jgi:hypothetical protein
MASSTSTVGTCTRLRRRLRSVIEVVNTRKNRHEREPMTLKKMFRAIEIPLLCIVQMVQGKVICVRGSPTPKNRAMKMQLRIIINVG